MEYLNNIHIYTYVVLVVKNVHMIINEVQNVDERKKKLKMNKIKKGVYIIHFENDDKNIYKIGNII